MIIMRNFRERESGRRVEAVQIAVGQELADLRTICADIQPAGRLDRHGFYRVSMDNGCMVVQCDDWLVRDSTGESYPCWDHIFRARYAAE